ncbi:class I SAM-dependent methyltransferase [Herbaspirillum sp. LeCh32-8]|uniref:methyltransferase n=1 Tax=Herbaspirillum sp. LeCh32-8 TaxID=2821356 RepID=UPI001AE9018A|nr:class I SAM-dependent methyltransferase [Herbaspirillum sp. LeCh32-8]MBP0600564.1 class I SAM-dependent methyltransferase [Herbaspirillum sp. LeCh32-8]
MTHTDDSAPHLAWQSDGAAHTLRWHSEAGNPPPKRVVEADDQIPADTAYKLACEGTGLLWRGDFQNARQLLQALGRRIDRARERADAKKKAAPKSEAVQPGHAFHQHRQVQAQRARILGMLLIPVEPGFVIPLRRAPEVQAACREAYGEPLAGESFAVSLRELQGLIGAHEWRKKGVAIAALDGAIHPYYGVFSPVRGEYVDLVAQAPLPSTELAFDIGVGTGVLSAVLARRGVRKVVATDMDERALACARENLQGLGVLPQVELQKADLFPEGRASLIVCNPPWLPARPSSPIEHAVYDPDSRMLLGFLKGLGAHLAPGGEGWLIMSDFAEQLGLRAPGMLTEAIAAAGLEVAARHDIKPRHGKAVDRDDPLHAARSKETTTLWRLKVRT